MCGFNKIFKKRKKKTVSFPAHLIFIKDHQQKVNFVMPFARSLLALYCSKFVLYVNSANQIKAHVKQASAATPNTIPIH